MSILLKKLAELADEVDKKGSYRIANELDELIKELAPLVEEEENYSAICPDCLGQGGTDETLFCPTCKGGGYVKEV